MKTNPRWAHFILGAVLAALPLLISGPWGPPSAWAAQAASQQYPHIVDHAFVAEYATLPVRTDVTLIDSRPRARKYAKGHIPGAISIPDRKFDKYQHLLPENKEQLLIFYCGGRKCPLSHKSAFKAEQLGYSNVRVYAAGYPDWKKQGKFGSVSTKYVKKLLDRGTTFTLVDARPKKRKYDRGHIPKAVSIPNSQFDKYAHQLPEDKSQAVIFYCGGPKCTLSPKAAAKAKAMGYTNLRLFTDGYPAWKQAYGQAGGAKQALKAGKEEGTIALSAFKKLLAGKLDTIHLIDVRDKAEYAQGTLPTAKNWPLDNLDKTLSQLPSDKPIVFICATGSRAGEAYDLVKAMRDDLKIFFLEAEITFQANGGFSIKKPTV